MTKGKRGHVYNDDYFDDGYDDDDFYNEEGDYDAYDDHPATSGKQQADRQLQHQTHKCAAPSATRARAAGASKLAQFLCDPPPRAPGGKLQRGAKPDPAAKALQKPAYPVAPHLAQQPKQTPATQQQQGASRAGGQAASGEAAIEPFRFDTPSPDDAVKAAQERRAGAMPPPSTPAPTAPSLPQNKTFLRPSPMMQQQRQQQQQGTGQVEAVASAVAALNLGAVTTTGGLPHPHGTRHPHLHVPDAAATTATSHTAGGGLHGLHTRRRVAGYTMEADLAREVEAASAAEAPAPPSNPPTAAAADSDAPPEPPPEHRLPLHLVVLGHVDAGKSSLMGRLLYEVGQVSQKEVHKYQRDAAAAGKGSFAWAWILDERPEERERGVTVDVAMTRFYTRRFAVTLLDAPGHRDFVPKMIAGAAQADAALLLVDGSPGGFEAGFSEGSGGLHGAPGGQTREHAALARSLGIEQLAVVVSKLDTVRWDKTRFDSIRSALLPYLKSVGFKESSLQWLPASGPLGENLVGPPKAPALSTWWSEGPCVLSAIDNFTPRERATHRPLRMPVSDVFKSRTGAVVLGGKVEGGALRVGCRVTLVPGAGQSYTVRSLEVAGAAAHLARAGDSCEVALVAAHGGHGAGHGGGGGTFDPATVPAGAVLCHPDFPAVVVTRFELRIIVLDVSVPLLRGHAVTLHAHVAREEGHISALTAILDPRSGEVIKARPRCLTRGQTALVEVTASRGLVLEEYGDYRSLGRVALREGGRTVAVGVVTRLLQ